MPRRGSERAMRRAAAVLRCGTSVTRRGHPRPGARAGTLSATATCELDLAIAGTRGIPARYGGFETFAEELARRLVGRGHKVTVYAREGYVPRRRHRWH